MPTPDVTNEEALREALLNVQRLREKEKAAHEQTETLIKGLHILNESSTVSGMYREILGVLQRIIPFECAAILVETSDGNLSTAVCTDDRLKFSRVPIVGIFERCLQGRAAALTHLSRVKEWPVSDSPTNKPASSALLVALPGLERPTLIVCAGTKDSALHRRDLELLVTFSPLATQAVKRAGELEKLSILVNKLDYYAHYDMLTGLPNRTLFDIRLEQELRAPLPPPRDDFAVMFLDLDHFKHTNDTFGHGAGDILLSEIAFRISGVIDRDDTIARMGGDEFALIIRGAKDADELAALCESIIARLSAPLFLCKSCVEPSASIGVVTSAKAAESAQAIMQHADIALYDAKDAGRRRFSLFSPAMKTRLARRNEIETRLKSALQNREFSLVYQPIVEATSRACLSVEALIRWEVEGEIRFRPDEFVPLAERNGTICEIGEWVFERALSDTRAWLREAPGRTVAVNLSDTQLHEPDLAERLLSISRDIDVDPHQVELELSERIVAAEIDETVLANLGALSGHGFCFSYDDFGTGQSSFLNLQKLPGTTLKIDRSFVENLEGSADQRRLVEGIVHFAHSLGLEVVAEGVETDPQLQILAAMRCDRVQGYLLSKPVPLTQFLATFGRSVHDPGRIEPVRRAS